MRIGGKQGPAGLKPLQPEEYSPAWLYDQVAAEVAALPLADRMDLASALNRGTDWDDLSHAVQDTFVRLAQAIAERRP